MKTEDKQKLGNKIFHKVWFILFLIFLTLYISQASGYYESSISKKTTFTNEQIKRFEQDIKDGKNVDIEKYLDNTTKNYQNKLSKTALSFSETISKYTKMGIEKFFSIIGNAVEEEK